MKRPSIRLVVRLTSAAILLSAVNGGAWASIGDKKLADQAQRAIDRGSKWLRAAQMPNGSWGDHPGLTALALTALGRNPAGERGKDKPAIEKGIRFLREMIKPDGSIYDKDLPVYNTSVAVMALCASGDPGQAAAIQKARAFLVGQQEDEERGVQPADKFYGGIGYGDDEPHPDLSNLQFAVEALRDSALDKNDPAWGRALQFLQRCQNRSESNDQAWAGNDGGFVYAPGQSQAGGTKSYGSMTYAAIKSLIYAHMAKDDPRVQAALEWIRNNYTLKENPGMGPQGLFYYYNTFAKALRAYGEPVIVDAKGKKHVWAEELARTLLARQQKDGSWFNPDSNRWWEGNKLLVTAESIFALQEALAELGPAKDPCPSLTKAGSAELKSGQ